MTAAARLTAAAAIAAAGAAAPGLPRRPAEHETAELRRWRGRLPAAGCHAPPPSSPCLHPAQSRGRVGAGPEGQAAGLKREGGGEDRGLPACREYRAQSGGSSVPAWPGLRWRARILCTTGRGKRAISEESWRLAAAAPSCLAGGREGASLVSKLDLLLAVSMQGRTPDQLSLSARARPLALCDSYGQGCDACSS